MAWRTNRNIFHNFAYNIFSILFWFSLLRALYADREPAFKCEKNHVLIRRNWPHCKPYQKWGNNTAQLKCIRVMNIFGWADETMKSCVFWCVLVCGKVNNLNMIISSFNRLRCLPLAAFSFREKCFQNRFQHVRFLEMTKRVYWFHFAPQEIYPGIEFVSINSKIAWNFNRMWSDS